MASAHLSAGKSVRKQGGTREGNTLHLEPCTASVIGSERKEEDRLARSSGVLSLSAHPQGWTLSPPDEARKGGGGGGWSFTDHPNWDSNPQPLSIWSLVLSHSTTCPPTTRINFAAARSTQSILLCAMFGPRISLVTGVKRYVEPVNYRLPISPHVSSCRYMAGAMEPTNFTVYITSCTCVWLQV